MNPAGRGQAVVPGMWGLFYALTEEGIHPEDREWVAFQWNPHQQPMPRDVPHIFQVIAVEGEYLRLAHPDLSFRGLAGRFSPVERVPRLRVGDAVITKDKGESGKVRMIEWHFNRKEFFYLLNKGVKRSTRRYFDEELE